MIFGFFYLESKEYDDYRLFRQLKREIGGNELNKAKTTYEKLKNSPLVERHAIYQFLEYVRICLDEELKGEAAIAELYEALHEPRESFEPEKILKRRLTYNEVYILSEISSEYFDMGDYDEAINITQALIDSRENSRTSEDDRAKLLPVLMFNLSNYLGKAGRIKESLEVCEQAVKLCREYSEYRCMPQLLHNMATGFRLIGEKENIYRPILMRAYHTACAFWEFDVVKLIEKEAEEKFGILDYKVFFGIDSSK